MSISRTEQDRITAATRKAAAFISKLRPGDLVLVTVDGREHLMTVSRGPGLADGQFGAWEGIRVTVTLGPGRWSTEIVADGVGHGRYSIRRSEES